MPVMMAQFDPAGFFRDHLDLGSSSESQFIYHLAYVYATYFGGNRYCHVREILTAIWAVGDHISRSTGVRGETVHEHLGSTPHPGDQTLPHLESNCLSFSVAGPASAAI